MLYSRAWRRIEEIVMSPTSQRDMSADIAVAAEVGAPGPRGA
jgi:hypothetical protein